MASKALYSLTLTGVQTWLRESLPRGFCGNVFAAERRKHPFNLHIRRGTQQLDFD